jgi:hypothetical protein
LGFDALTSQAGVKIHARQRELRQVFRPTGPGFPGPFSFARRIAEIAGICDKLARLATAHRNHLQRGISYTRICLTLIPTTKSVPRGWARAVRNGQRTRSGEGRAVRACLSIFLRISDQQLAKRSGCRAGRPLVQFQPTRPR